MNGTTVYIPANAQTIILPPGYTGPQQQHQIVLHTQPQQQQYAPIPQQNGPSAVIPPHSSSSQQSNFIAAASSVHQPHQQHIQVQPSHISSTHQRQTLVDGLSTNVEVTSSVAHYVTGYFYLKIIKLFNFKQLLSQMHRPHHLHMPHRLYRKALHKPPTISSLINNNMQPLLVQPCNLLRRLQQRRFLLQHPPLHKCNKLHMLIQAEPLYQHHQNHWSQLFWHPQAR